MQDSEGVNEEGAAATGVHGAHVVNWVPGSRHKLDLLGQGMHGKKACGLL